MGHSVLLGDVETKVLQMYRTNTLPPDVLFDCLRRRYLGFFAHLQPEGMKFSGWQGLSLDPLLQGRRPLSQAAAEALANFVSEQQVAASDTQCSKKGCPFLLKEVYKGT